MTGKGNNRLDKLADLVAGDAQPVEPQSIGDPELDAMEREAVGKINKVLEFVSGETDDIFDMQALIAACADELRMQIREMVTGEGEDE